MHSATAQKFGVSAGQKVRVRQEGEAHLEVAIDDRLPQGVVRVPAAHASTAPLGAMFGELTVERA